jgi:hypothetical protein
LPLSRGAGWSWGARSRDRAWVVGVGRGGYVGPEGWSSTSKQNAGHSTSAAKHSTEESGHAGSGDNTYPPVPGHVNQSHTNGAQSGSTALGAGIEDIPQEVTRTTGESEVKNLRNVGEARV